MDIFNPTTGEILKIPSPDLSGYVPYTGATGDVDLGTHNLSTKEINQYATAEYDGPTLGPELLDDTGWTSTGWTGSWSTGWTAVDPYTANTLSRTVSLTAGHTYFLRLTQSEYDGTIDIGGIPQIYEWIFDGAVYYFTAVDSSDLVLNCTYCSGPMYLSLKEKISDVLPIYEIYDSTNTKTFEIHNSQASLNNIFLGKNVGKINYSGTLNLGLGIDVLSKNFSGQQNVGIGANALKNSNSFGNTAIGYNSALNTTTGFNNVGVGVSTLYNNISGYNNSAIGDSVLYNNIDGYGNIGLASSALRANTSGYYNTGVGSYALGSNTTGYYNTGVGVEALRGNTTGNDNIGIGYYSGRSYGVGTLNENSTYSIFIGRDTKAAAANGVNEIVIGYNATGNGSNTVTLGHTDITKTYLRGDIYPVDGKNIVLGTTTGMKIGTATNQKLSVYNATPVVQQAATTDLGVALSNFGLRAVGTAYPITTSGAVSFTGNFTHNTGTATFNNGFTIADARNIVLNTTTGTKIGTATTQKLAFYNSTPIVQPANTVAIDTTLVNLGLRATGGDANFATRVTQPGTFAEIYVADGVTAQSIASGATYTKLTAFTTNGSSSNCTADATNDKITITKAGKYLVTCSVSGNDGATGATFKMALFYDGVEQNNIHSTNKFNAGSEIDTMEMSGIVVSAANKDIDVRLSHDGGAAVNFTTQYANLTITYIGE